MSKHESTRRSFLVRAAVGAGAVAGSGLVPDAYTQTLDEHKNEAAAPSQSHSTPFSMARFSITNRPRRLRRSPNG